MPTTPVLDTFTGTDGTNLPTHDAHWTALRNTLQLLSNQCVGTVGGGNENIASWSTSFGPGIECYFNITQRGAAGEYCYHFIPGSATVDPRSNTATGYYFFLQFNATTDVFTFYREDANQVITQLGPSINLPAKIAPNDQFYSEIIGSRLAFQINGTELGNTTDSTYGSTGVLIIALANTTVMIDNFGGGTHVVSSTPPLRMLMGVGV